MMLLQREALGEQPCFQVAAPKQRQMKSEGGAFRHRRTPIDLVLMLPIPDALLKLLLLF